VSEEMIKPKYLGTNITSEYKDIINRIIIDLPLSGEVHAEEIMILAHYSPNLLIKEFYASNVCNWTATLAFDSNTLSKVIGFDYKQFQSVYFIKIGVNHENYSKGDGCGFMDEHRVRIKIENENFKRVAINYNPDTCNYDLIS
jgi:hypothetical protein